MKYALFLGCKIPARLPAYAASTRAVLEHLASRSTSFAPSIARSPPACGPT